MKLNIDRFAAMVAATINPVPFNFDSTEYHYPTKCNIPVTYPINNRHERRKQKVMKRKKK